LVTDGPAASNADESMSTLITKELSVELMDCQPMKLMDRLTSGLNGLHCYRLIGRFSNARYQLHIDPHHWLNFSPLVQISMIF
jgi:hypothetical protein